MSTQPHMMKNPQIDGLIDYCYGREAQGGDVGAVALFMQTHVQNRPALTSGQPSQWPDLGALKTHVGWSAPACTAAQVDTALAAAGLS